MIPWEAVKDFWEYLDFYPEEDEPDFDGVHFGIKGIRANAPDSAKKAFQAYQEMQNKAEREGMLL